MDEVDSKTLFYFSESSAYIKRLFLGIVNACDPILSKGLPESILKKRSKSTVKRYHIR